MDSKLSCKYCGKECFSKNSLAQHEIRCKSNPNRLKLIRITNGSDNLRVPESKLHLYPDYVLGESNVKTTKGLIKVHNDGRTMLINPQELDNYLSLGWKRGSHLNGVARGYGGRAITKEAELLRRERISSTMKSNKISGGYRNGSGRGKKGWYKGIYCDSSWELAFVIYHIDHGLMIRRCTNYRTYEYNGRTHKYLPDFITDKGIIEIKGFTTPSWEAKLAQNPDIIVLYYDEMKMYLDYAVSKYGSDFTKLYDNNDNQILGLNSAD